MIKQARRLAVVLIYLLALPASGAEEPPLLKKSITIGESSRSFLVFDPRPGQSTAKPPLVIVLHGGGGNAENAATMTNFTETARREGFLVAFPNGSGRRENRLLTWNAGHCCGYAMGNRVDDSAFIGAMIDLLVAEYRADPRRVFVTGMSNGAMMTHYLGIALPGKIAAIAPVAGTLFGDESLAPAPVPALIINGAADESVPPAGGPPGGRGSFAWEGVPMEAAEYQGEFWSRANHCQSQPTEEAVPELHSIRWVYRCPAGQPVIRYLVKDNGHAWPGGEKGSRRGDTPTETFNATEIIWQFFSQLGN